MNIRRPAILLVSAATAVTLLAGCSQVDTDAGQVAVQSNNYLVFPRDRTIDKCYGESHTEYDGVGNDFFYYPGGQRTWDFNNTPNADSGPIPIVKDNVPMELTGLLTFELNTDCAVLKEFHKKIGVKKFGASNKNPYIGGDNQDDFSGWEAMLQVYVLNALRSASGDAAAQLKDTYTNLSNGNAKAAMTTLILQLLPLYVKAAMGGEYFITFGLTLNKPIITNQEVVNALALKTVAELKKDAALAENDAIASQKLGIKDIVDLLGADGYNNYVRNQLTARQLELLSKAIEKGQISILPVPLGSDVNIPTK